MSTQELAPEGRRMLRLEARNSQTPIERKPPWIKTRVRTGPEYTSLKNLVRAEGLHTVCEGDSVPSVPPSASTGGQEFGSAATGKTSQSPWRSSVLSVRRDVSPAVLDGNSDDSSTVCGGALQSGTAWPRLSTSG